MNNPSKQHGLTLVELLVAITILSIVSALVIPRLRIANKERNIRETARVVGSVFSAARDRAVANGGAGVVIERNLNFIANADGDNVYFAGTRMYQLRATPPYTGSDNGEMAVCLTVNDTSGNPLEIEVEILQPLEDNILRAGDSIRLGNGLARYRIKEILAVRQNGAGDNVLPLVLEWDNDPNTAVLDLNSSDYITNWPAPEIGSSIAFSIERQPRKIRSSVVDLPAGYIIDMRYSGPFDTAAAGGIDGNVETYTAFGLAIDDPANASLVENREIQIHFDSKGAIDRATFNGESVLVGQSMYFFINEYDPNIVGNTLETAEALLGNPTSLWLTIGFNGGANIGYNAPPVANDVATMISNARTISRSRTSANQ